MNYYWKGCFHIDNNASTDQVFILLVAVQSDNEDEIDKLMNDFDTEFIAPEDIELTDNPDDMSALTLEGNVHVVDQGTTQIKEQETNKKRKKSHKEVSRSNGNAMFLQILKRFVFLRAELRTSLMKVLHPLIFMNKLLILMFWLRYLFKKQPLFAKKLEEVSHQFLGNESYHWCQLHHDCKPIAKHTNVLGLQSFCR